MANKIIPIVLTAMVLAVLVIAGNTNAFSVNITLDNNRSTAGQVINYHVSLGEIKNLSSIQVKVGSLICNFDADGNVIGTCSGITLKKLSEQNLGYGYGENLGYKVTLDRDVFPAGDYTLEFTANTSEGSGSDEVSFNVKSRGKSGK